MGPGVDGQDAAACAVQLLDIKRELRRRSLEAPGAAKSSADARGSWDAALRLAAAPAGAELTELEAAAGHGRGRSPDAPAKESPINGFFILLAILMILGFLLIASVSGSEPAEEEAAAADALGSVPAGLERTPSGSAPAPPKLGRSTSAPTSRRFRRRTSVIFDDEITRYASQQMIIVPELLRRHTDAELYDAILPPRRTVTAEDLPEEQLLSFRETAINIFSLYVGAGILQLPYAFSIAGWMGGGIIGLCSAIMGFSATLIFDSVYFLEKNSADAGPSAGSGSGAARLQLDFADMGRLAFGHVGETLIGVIFSIELWLYGAYFVILASRNLNCFVTFLPDNLLITAVGGACLALMFVPARYLAWLNSSLGISSLFAAVGAMIAGGLMLPVSVTPAERLTMGTTAGLLKCFGISAVGFAGHPCLPSIYATCGPKKHFNSALGLGIGAAAMFYVFVGSLGYYLYGPFVEDVFTLNLGLSLRGEAIQHLGWLGPVVSAAIAVKLIITYPFVIEPVCILLYKPDNAQAKISRFQQTFARITVSLALLLLSVAFQNRIAIFADLIGCVATMATCVFFPCFCFLKLLGDQASLAKRAAVVLVVIAGVGLAVVGTKVAIEDMLTKEA